jgi:succinate dehydrogenase/fumarate reductase cytochrome b subunit
MNLRNPVLWVSPVGAFSAHVNQVFFVFVFCYIYYFIVIHCYNGIRYLFAVMSNKTITKKNVSIKICTQPVLRSILSKDKSVFQINY